jgi:protease I
MSTSRKHILIPVEDLYEDMELHYPRYRLLEAGCQVTVAGTGAATFTGKRGYPVTVDAHLRELGDGIFDGVVVPGGFAPDKLRVDSNCLRLVRDVHHRGGLVAVICHSPWVAISAGIVKGRRVTGVDRVRDDLQNAGARYEDAEVVIDQNLISSRTPNDLPAFLKAIVGWLAEH